MVKVFFIVFCFTSTLQLEYLISSNLANLISSSLQETFPDVYHCYSHFVDEETCKDLVHDFCEFKESFLHFINPFY